MANRYASYLSLFAKIDALIKKGNAIVTLEGGSASGKTTLARILQEVYGCTVFHMDDFFLRPEQRTPERFAEVGGNVDRERFYEEVLKPLKNNETVRYRPFDCSTQSLKDELIVTPEKLTVIEGAYSMHPAFEEYYDLAVFLDIEPEYQRTRILKRNSPQLAKRFFEEWIPLENRYFSETKIKERCAERIVVTMEA
ncbi:MAG: phosphoribulokinase [Clostridia bacterium]|nr:phosphoribulokinase [Clostridia bacterium]